MKRSSASSVRIASLAAGLLALAACSKADAPAASSAAASDTTGDAAAIHTADAQMNNYLKVHGLEGAVSYYAHDGVLMTPGAKPVVGSDALREAFTDMMNDPKFDLSFTADKVVVSKSGDLAYSIGTFSQSETNPKTHAAEHATGSYVTVYKKTTGGEWKVVADIATPGPAAP
jgi:ketosteroid isomerase-like protein